MDCDNQINLLRADVLATELAPLGLVLDRLDAHPAAPADRAETCRAAALQARRLIESGAELPQVRRACLQSPALLTLLEAVLFDRAARRGVLAVSVDWSAYGRSLPTDKGCA